ncbi:MAG: hypothetical protein V4485_04880 [Pseudomonadota bacterium]
MPKLPMPAISFASPMTSPAALQILQDTEVEIERYSITPRTHKARVISNNGADCFTMSDTFEYKGNKVLRFGINVLDPKICVVNGQMLSEAITLASSSAASGTASSSKYGRSEAQKVVMHSLEIGVLESAVAHLMNSSDCAVLVDVFERALGGLKTDTNGRLTTHTVVLYKDSSPAAVSAAPSNHTKILVIDPSNFMFSSHLANNNTSLQSKFNAEVEVLYKSVQIYKPLTLTGYQPTDSRDCIDISVKIAFTLSKSTTPVSLNAISAHPAIVAIANIKVIDQCIIEAKVNPRIKQSSSTEHIEVYYQVEKLASKMIDIASTADKQLEASFLSRYKGVLAKNGDYDSTIAELRDLCLHFPQDLTAILIGDCSPVDNAVNALTTY